MNRRAVAGVVHILAMATIAMAVFALVVLSSSAPGEPGVALASDYSTPAVSSLVPAEPEPPTTENPFLPEDRDLTDCLGTVERPGCGSKARGGWRQTLVFLMMGTGLVIIFGRVGFAMLHPRDQSHNQKST